MIADASGSCKWKQTSDFSDISDSCSGCHHLPSNKAIRPWNFACNLRWLRSSQLNPWGTGIGTVQGLVVFLTWLLSHIPLIGAKRCNTRFFPATHLIKQAAFPIQPQIAQMHKVKSVLQSVRARSSRKQIASDYLGSAHLPRDSREQNWPRRLGRASHISKLLDLAQYGHLSGCLCAYMHITHT